MGFLTLSDCGEEVSDDSPLSPELRLAMTKTIETGHARHCGMATCICASSCTAARLAESCWQASLLHSCWTGQIKGWTMSLSTFCGTLLDCPPPAGSVPACTAPDVLRHCPLASTPALKGFLLNMCVTFSTQKPLSHLDVLTLS